MAIDRLLISISDELSRDDKTSRVNEVTMSTPLCVALQIALVQLLRSWGISPSAVTSHSSGEIAAAFAAGALSIRSAMAIVFARGELAADVGRYLTSKGGMIAVGLGSDTVGEYLSRVTKGQIVAACINSPTSITASGDVPAIEELEMILKKENIFARRLKVDAAWHSHHMRPIADPYLVWMQKFVTPEKHLNDVIYSSPTTGGRMTSAKAIGQPKHWVHSLTHPVQFVEAFSNMCFVDSETSDPDVDIVIEVGPHAALSGPIQEILTLPQFKGSDISYLTCLVRKSSAMDTMHTLVCELIRRAYPVDLGSINFPKGAHDVRVLPDLPHYPWNHRTRHWSEPRINKAHRERPHAPHDLLGSLALGANMLAPLWRNIIRVSDLPWVRDHTVQSNIVYPGAGFICMAIEGALQISQSNDKRISGFHLRDIDILQALVIPDTPEGIEVQLTLRPCNDKAIYAKGAFDFQICSVSQDNVWLEHCKGLISVETLSAAEEEHATWKSAQTPLRQSGSRRDADFRMRIDPKDVYSGLRSVGIYHGPIFQNLKAIKADKKRSLSTLAIADTASTMPYKFQHEHVLDPTTLDTIFQATYTALPGAGSQMSNPHVPRSIKSLWVSHNIARTPGHRFKAYSEIDRTDQHSFHAAIDVFNDAGHVDNTNAPSEVLLKIEDFVCQSLGNTLGQQREPYEHEKLSVVKWAPDLSCIEPSFLKNELGCAIDPNEAEMLMDLRRVCCYYIYDALATVTASDIQQFESHQRKFHVWMKLQVGLASSNQLAPDSSTWMNDNEVTRLAVIEKCKAASVNGEMTCRLGPHIKSILRREIMPLELMLEDKLLQRYYVEGLKWDRSSQQVGKVVKHFAHKNPRAKILEIGGGTGGTTRYALSALGADDSGYGPLAASYYFTDVSSGFFEAAQKKFKAWESDLIIACQVLHATKSMDNTMANVRKLLKPGGRLCIMETTKDQLDMQFVFGLLPGWWLSKTFLISLRVLTTNGV